MLLRVILIQVHYRGAKQGGGGWGGLNPPDFEKIFFRGGGLAPLKLI